MLIKYEVIAVYSLLLHIIINYIVNYKCLKMVIGGFV